MPLNPGNRLGPYEIQSALGAGGMGEVYKATDTNLGRQVAIKVLPEAFAQDPERLARFEREAKTLASLNHPNIAQIYGLERSGTTSALVMELVEGEDLSQRIARGPIPLDEALPIAKQIAEALEAAHEQGIIHRDLKPANVKVRPDGTVKVLDFGLAKLAESSGSSTSNASLSPTITSPAMMTGIGVLLGTAVYMSPEQAKGRAADKRSDIWAFGCVLYEMLTGKRAFEGEDVGETLAWIITKQPEWAALPATTPPGIRKLLRRCLEKDRKRRLADAADVRLEIDDVLTTPADEANASGSLVRVRSSLWRQPAVIGGLALVLGGLLTGSAMWNLRPTVVSPAVTRFSVPLSSGQQLTEFGGPLLAISRDGTRMVFVANRRLYFRSMSELESKPIAGTEVFQGLIASPVFSPDGKSIAFVSGLPPSIRRIGVTGGTALTICEGCGGLTMSWDNQDILFVQLGNGFPVGLAGERSTTGGNRIMRVPANGGQPEVLFNIADGVPFHVQMLPGGRAVLFGLLPGVTDLTGTAEFSFDKAQIIVQSLESGERKTLIDGGSAPRYLPTGHIVYAREGVLLARPFDVEGLRVTGEAIPVVEGIRRPTLVAGSSSGGSTGAPYFDVSDTGSLVYVPGPVTTSVQRDLALLDRQIAVAPLKLPPAPYEFPRVSPDGKWVAVGTSNDRAANIWIYQLSGASAIRQLTFSGKNRFPVWSGDSRSIAFQSDREGDLAIFRQVADGSGAAERLTKPDPGTAHVPDSWSADGNNLLLDVIKGSQHALWTLSGDKKMIRVGDFQNLSPLNATFSPDGRWLTYTSSGTVSVEPFPTTGSKYVVASGGIQPVWSRDGKTLLFRRATTGEFIVTRVNTERSFTFSNPQVVSTNFPDRASNAGTRNHDILPDGKIIGVIAAGQAQSATTPQINVVLNWFEELKRLVPTK